jgi:hypothetical protein
MSSLLPIEKTQIRGNETEEKVFVNPHLGRVTSTIELELMRLIKIWTQCWGRKIGAGASYYTWLEYFTNVDLYHIEYNADCARKWANKTDKATIFTGDQADTTFLRTFLRKAGGNFDIIIDDGGHTMNQQKTSLKILWSSIKPGGVYFIEDLATSYAPCHGGGAIGSNTTMNDLKIMLDDINRYQDVPITSPEISNEVISFEFTQECVALTNSKLPDISEPQGSQLYNI